MIDRIRSALQSRRDELAVSALTGPVPLDSPNLKYVLGRQKGLIDGLSEALNLLKEIEDETNAAEASR